MDKKFKKEIKKRPGGENISLCYSCGSCTSTCPISEIDHSYNPRLIIKKTILGYKDEVLQSDDLWKCIQCRRCVAHCPQNVKFADIIRVLRDMAIEEGHYSDSLTVKIDQLDRSIYKLRLKMVKEHLEEGMDLQQAIAELNGGEGNG
jgi:heterodisulfide reductase subunit C